MIEKNAPLVETEKKERYLKYCVSATDLLLMKEETKIHLEVTETFRSRSKLAFRCIFLIVGSMSPDSSKSIFTFRNPQAEHRNFYQCEFVLPPVTLCVNPTLRDRMKWGSSSCQTFVCELQMHHMVCRIL